MDLCQNLTDFVTRKEGLSCVRSVPNNENWYKRNIGFNIGKEKLGDGFPHITNYQVFKEKNKFSGYPYYIDVDLDKQLTELYDKKQPSRFDAEVEFSSVWRSLRDPHSFRMMSTILSRFSFIHPIALGSSIDETSGKQIISIEHNLFVRNHFDKYNEVYETNIPFEEYNHWIIEKIDGIDSMEYLKSFSKGTGGKGMGEGSFFFQRDFATNFNQLLIPNNKSIMYVPCAYYFRNSQKWAIPENFVTYTIRNPSNKTDVKEIEIDFLTAFMESDGASVYPLNSTEHLSYIIDNYGPFGVPSSSSSSSFEKEKLLTQQQHHSFLFNVHNDEDLQKLRNSIHFFDDNEEESSEWEAVCVATHNEFGFTMFPSHPETVIFIIIAESPLGGGFIMDYDQYINDLVSCFKIVKQKKFSRMVVDLRYNVGGLPRLSFLMASGITKTPLPAPKHIQTPLVMTKDAAKAFQDKEFGFFDQVETVVPIQFTDDRKDHEMTELNGETTTYSPLLLDDMEDFDRDVKKESGFEGFEPEDVVVLTTGQSCSAGGEFMKFLQFEKLGKIVGLGGIVGEEMDTSTVCGGLTAAFINVEEMFYHHISWASFFPQHSLYSVFDKSKVDYRTFDEFRRYPPDFRIYDWKNLFFESFADSFYEEVLSIFDKCTYWNIKTNSSCESLIRHGVYGNPCIVSSSSSSNNYDSNICVLKRCEDGYYLDEENSKCLEIEKAPLYSTLFAELKKDDNDKNNQNNHPVWAIELALGVMSFAAFVLVVCLLCLACAFCVISAFCMISIFAMKKRLQPNFEKYSAL